MLRSILVSGVACLMITGAVLSAEAPTQGDPAQALGAGSFQIRNQKYGDLLRPEDANSATGTRIVLYPGQPWKCMTWKLNPVAESRFQLQNHFTSKTFAAAAESTKTPAAVTQVPYGKSPEDRPVWRFTRLGTGAYRITDAKSGNALTAAKEDNGSTVRVVIEPWRDGEEQKWQLVPIDPKSLTM